MTMRSNKAIVNAAGQTITTAGLAAGGALNPEQAKKFIQQTFEATPLSGLVRHELRSAKTGEIDKIGVGRRLLRKKTEKENPYANAWVNVADVLATREGSEGNYKYYMNYLPDPTKYAGGTVSSDYVKLSYEMAKDGGYVKELGKDKRYPFIRMTSVVGGSSTTYYADYYWPAQSAVCAVVAGGDLNAGRSYGPRYFYCGNAPSDSGWNRRARLS